MLTHACVCVLKQILIPFLLVTCVFNAIHVVVELPMQSLFLLVLLMSDVMAMVG
jgi:phosphatidylinositol glycan class N